MQSTMQSTSDYSKVISSDKVEGTNVYNAQGEKLGSIDNLMIDKASGQVRYAVLEFGGFLGMGTDRYPLPWSMLKYDTMQDGYVVPMDKDTLGSAPRYADGDAPEYDDDYGRQVNDYYGASSAASPRL
jgi:sporulation protein YlmC with PRC-barrel domain